MTLTGQVHYRRNWRGKIILQVEFWSRANRRLAPERRKRDAKWEDLLALERGECSSECPPMRPKANGDAMDRALGKEKAAKMKRRARAGGGGNDQCAE